MTQESMGFQPSAFDNDGCPSAPSERFLRGLARLRELDGDLADRLLTSLIEIAPDFALYVVEFPFGDIYTRPGLDLKTREIATIAALTALGTAPAQLKVHIAAALNVGCTQEEIAEVIMQMSVYAGFPAALNGLAAMKDVVDGRGAQHGVAAASTCSRSSTTAGLGTPPDKTWSSNNTAPDTPVTTERRNAINPAGQRKDRK